MYAMSCICPTCRRPSARLSKVRRRLRASSSGRCAIISKADGPQENLISALHRVPICRRLHPWAFGNPAYRMEGCFLPHTQSSSKKARPGYGPRIVTKTSNNCLGARQARCLQGSALNPQLGLILLRQVLSAVQNSLQVFGRWRHLV